MCKIGAWHVFLGSRLGNSLLLRIAEASSTAAPTGNGETPAKRARLHSGSEDGQGGAPTDLEDLSIYGIAPTETSHDSRLKLSVCDSTRPCIFFPPSRLFLMPAVIAFSAQLA